MSVHWGNFQTHFVILQPKDVKILEQSQSRLCPLIGLAENPSEKDPRQKLVV